MGRASRVSVLPGGGIHRPRHVHEARSPPQGSLQDPRHGGQRALLPGHPSRILRGDREAPRRDGAEPARGGGLAARGGGEALRPRSRVRPRPQRGAQPRARGEPDLPDRPLPRQGDRAEHHGLPFRQWLSGAGVEPQLRRPRPDHRRGDRGRGGPRQLLRQRGRGAGHDAESHAPAPRPRGHGAAHLLPGGGRAGRARQGAQGHAQLQARGRAEGNGEGTVRTRGRQRPGRPRLPERAKGLPDLEHGDVRGDEAGGRELALGRRAFLPPLGQAADPTRHRDHDPVPSAAPPALRGAGGAGRAQSPRPPHPARRGHRDPDEGQASRAEHGAEYGQARLLIQGVRRDERGHRVRAAPL